jgi:hypothetical protein|nr:MAG TPA: hypothetical protein [Caudoviricetes sp.]
MEYIVYIAFWLILLVMAIIACALFCIMVDIAKDGKAKGVSERELSDKLLMQYLDIRFSDETEEQSARRKIDTLECLAIELRVKYDVRKVASDFKHIKK